MTVSLGFRILAIAAPMIGASALWGGAPALREQMSLNGRWREGGVVPVYTGDSFDRKTYSRSVDVPAG
jgi:hypothetical protein